MSAKFEMHLIVPPKLVGTIVELMEGEGVIVSMNPHNEKGKRNGPRYAGGKRNKGISGANAALAIIKESAKPLTYDKIGTLMASRHNFSVTSASPVLAKLVAAKKIIVRNGLYSLAK